MLQESEWAGALKEGDNRQGKECGAMDRRHRRQERDT